MRLHTETNTESLPVKEILQKAVRSRSEQPIRKANFPIYSSQIRCGSEDNVGKFSIDEEKNMIVIGKTKYYYDDSLLVFRW